MNITRDTVIKENYTFLVADAQGNVFDDEHGVYNRDTRFLSRYRWRLPPAFQTLLAHTPRPDRFLAHYALLEGPSQQLSIQRRLELHATGLHDTLLLENGGDKASDLQLELEVGADFSDLFEVRGWRGSKHTGIECRCRQDRLSFSYRAADGLGASVTLLSSPPPQAAGNDGARFEIHLEPGASTTLGITVSLENPLETNLPAPSYQSWRRGFRGLRVDPHHRPVVARAIDDLRALLLFTEHGPVPAAGIPWFVAAFGRDALLTALMLLPWQPQVAVGTLHYLAAHQGKQRDAFREEAPGKIMHEIRFGELARTGRIPHSPYYGTIDATPLFLVLLHESYRHSGNLELVRRLKPHWEAALSWLLSDGDPDGDGFLEFQSSAEGRGLSVQSWKDSADSLSHADGSLATGAIAVSEVQGYAYAAYLAAAEFYKALGDDPTAQRWHLKAEKLKSAFHQAFWLEELATYAMALDGRKRPLAVQNSNAGQLLWSGIVPEETAPTLATTLFSPDNWSGWGIRTLGRGEVRYNPLSYHNGSVWPHDNALIAGGLARYGFYREARRIRRAIFELAASQWDQRLPELIGGYPRTEAPPVPYPTACRPQAWDAAALLYLLGMKSSSAAG